MTTIWQILTITGSLGIFLFGIKMLSESLQKAAGNRMRSILSAITANPARSIFTGLAVTATIQSSSAVSVMIISFVNAGLLNLAQSVGALIGANIGTTLTVWIISLLGFKFSLNLLLLPLIALSIPFYFSSKSRWKAWGEVMIGFALLFMGIEFMKSNLPLLDENSLVLEQLAAFADHGFLSVMLYIAAGLAFCALLQSSSVTLALILVMCNNGWIGYEMAAAAVLGINLGTTSTALLASLIANRQAKRAALGHLLFNVLGLLWALLFFKTFLLAADKLTILIEGNSAFVDQTSIPIALSFIHTLFNIITAIIVSLGLPHFIRLLETILPLSQPGTDYKLTFLKSPIGTSELSVVQASKEILVYGRRTAAMLEFIPQLLIEKDEESFNELMKRIEHYEDLSDSLEMEIAQFLTKLSESELSRTSTKKIRSMLQIIDELESINDVCNKMAVLINKKNAEKAWFNQKMRNEIAELHTLVKQSLEFMNRHLEEFEVSVDMAEVISLEMKINELRENLISKNQKRLKTAKIKYPTARYYSDFVNSLENIADLTLNVSESIADYQRKD
jgi:phosphate:Na+ symporter